MYIEMVQVAGFGGICFVNGFPVVKGSVYFFGVMAGWEEERGKNQDGKNQERRID